MESYISPLTLALANQLSEWIKKNIAVENPEVKRPGSSQIVCPFVTPSIDNDRLYMVFHPEVDGAKLEIAREVVLGYIRPFSQMPPWDEKGKQTKALLIVFPNLKDKDSMMLDHVFNDLKTEFVRNGLMLAQFHPNCDERGIYNRKWLSQKSPHSFIAVRHMAFHDILFVQKDREWFHEYNLIFGNKYKEEEKLEASEKLLVSLYHEVRLNFQKEKK